MCSSPNDMMYEAEVQFLRTLSLFAERDKIAANYHYNCMCMICTRGHILMVNITPHDICSHLSGREFSVG